MGSPGEILLSSKALPGHPPLPPIRLASRRLANNLAFAPMSGVSNRPARLIAREAGAGLVFTETLSAQALVRGLPGSWARLSTSRREAPLAVQIFGCEPAVLAEACRQLADHAVVWIDLNLGCPVPKLIRKGAGAALMREPARVGAAVAAMRGAFAGTLSVKLRGGWDTSRRNAPEVARVAVAAGAELVSVHGRTRAQQYRGRADRALIREVVRAVPGTPVFANGDVVRSEHVFEMLEETGAAGVMIGRGAVGNPWIFSQALARARGDAWREPTRAERLAVLERHVELLAESQPEPAARMVQLRRYVAAYSKGLAGGSHFRRHALQAERPEQIVERARDFLAPSRQAA